MLLTEAFLASPNSRIEHSFKSAWLRPGLGPVAQLAERHGTCRLKVRSLPGPQVVFLNFEAWRVKVPGFYGGNGALYLLNIQRLSALGGEHVGSRVGKPEIKHGFDTHTLHLVS